MNGSMSKARLLIVEDDFDISNMLKIYFTGQGYEVDIAPRGSEALLKTRQNLPHLIVLDIMLPDIDGYERFGIRDPFGNQIVFIGLR